MTGTMRRHGLPLLIIALTVLAGAFAVANLYMGHRVGHEVEQLARTLAAGGELRVDRLDYQRGFRGGTVFYDLSWQSDGENEVLEALRHSGLLPEDGLRIAGTLQLRHGPWAGSKPGFAMASGTGVVALPEDWRPILPDYPQQAPLLRFNAFVTLGGRLEMKFSAVDYHGRMAVPDFEGNTDLKLSGLKGLVGTDSRLGRLRLDVRLGQFSVVVRDANGVAEMALEDMLVEADIAQSRPRVWTGTTRMVLKRVAVNPPGSRLEIHDLSTESDTRITGNKLGSIGTLEVGETRLDEYRLLGGSLIVSLRGLDVDAFVELAELAERARADADGSAAEQDRQRTVELLEQIFAGGPKLAIDQLRLSLVEVDDLSAHLSLGIDGAPRVADHALQELAGALRIEADARIGRRALRHIAGLLAAEQLAAGAGEAEREAAAEATYAEFVQGIQALPFLTVTDEAVSVSAELSERRLRVGGNELMDVEQFITAVLLALVEWLGQAGPQSGA